MAAEAIEETAKMLCAVLNKQHERGLAQDIQDHVIRIYEACNFHDLTGQRADKVIATLKFIDERVTGMIDVCGQLDRLRARSGPPAAASGRHLVNGPRIEGDLGHASQDDIDLLFD